MILMYPFDDRKETIRISSHYQINGQNLNVEFSIDDRGAGVEDFYPIEFGKEKMGTLFPLENLWTSTCFEIFLKNKSAEDYYEFNFNSKGDWNVFYFSEYRKRVETYKNILDVKMIASKLGDRVLLNYSFDLKKLEKLRIPCQVNMAAVLKTKLGTSYWSQKHNGLKADFHDSKNFCLIL